jgi:hypothetical protein
LDLPDAVRDLISRWLEEVVALREAARSARGDARSALVARLPGLDAAMIAASRMALPPETMNRLRDDAAADLAVYRSRLTPEAWERSVERSVDQLVRDQLGLPSLAVDEI